MKVIKKNVYYCDFCKKKGMSAGSMGKHEKHCTANLNRECRMCETKSIADLIEKFKQRYTLVETLDDDPIFGATGLKDMKAEWTGEPVTLTEIKAAVDNCPMCVLAIYRQAKFGYHYFLDMIEKFDYQTECATYWAERNKVERADLWDIY